MGPEETPPPGDTPPPATDTPAPGGDTPPPADAPPAGSPSAPAAPKSMLEAIDFGIASSADGPPPAPADDDTPVPEGTPPPAPKPGEGTPPPSEPKPDSKANGKEPPPPVEPPPAKPAKAKEPPPIVDAVNDPVGPEVKGRTRERVTTLIGNVKELSTSLDRALAERDEILGLIHDTGATPDQYGQALDFLRAINSRDPAQIRAVIPLLQQQLAYAASVIGEPVPGVDMLSQHKDLLAEVEAGRLPREHAEEIAAARALRATRQHEGHQITQQRQLQQAESHARARLTALGRELASSDPLYEQKKSMLVPVLQPLFASLPPDKWEGAFRAAYSKLTLPNAPPPPPPPPPPSQPMRASQPLRAMQPAGTAKREPASMLDALNEGIEMGSRRR